MYRVLATGLACVSATFHSNASSLLTLPEAAPDTVRSIVHYGEPSPPLIEARDADGAVVSVEDAGDDRILVLTTSVLAVGPDAIPVTEEEVASVTVDEEPVQPAWIADDLSLTMRGGEEATETLSPQ